MSDYLTRLKEIENGKKFSNTVITEVSKVSEVSFGTFDTSLTVDIEKKLSFVTNESFQIELIRAWLHTIGEPEEDHFLVLDKCKTDPDALQYFLRHARGEFDEMQN